MIRFSFSMTVVLASVSLFIVSCNKRENELQASIQFFYENSIQGRIDTLTAKQLRRHDKQDTLIANQDFECKNK